MLVRSSAVVGFARSASAGKAAVVGLARSASVESAAVSVDFPLRRGKVRVSRCLLDEGLRRRRLVSPGVETESGVFLVVARRGRSGRSADVLITEVLFLGVSVLDDLFVDVTSFVVSFVYVSIRDVLVAKVVVYRTFWQISSGAWSISSWGGFERVRFFAGVAWWRLWRAVLTGKRSGGFSAAVHYRRTGTVSLAARRRIVAIFMRGRMDVVWVESSQVLASRL